MTLRLQQRLAIDLAGPGFRQFVEKFTIDVLVDTLKDAGFTVTYRRHTRPTGSLEGLGLFFATREAA